MERWHAGTSYVDMMKIFGGNSAGQWDYYGQSKDQIMEGREKKNVIPSVPVTNWILSWFIIRLPSNMASFQFCIFTLRRI